MKRFLIRSRESGYSIDAFETLKEAVETLERFEKEDKKDDIYEENFYEIYDLEKEEIVR